jgi:hypothetical protein
MGSTGAVIMGFFAGIFCVLALGPVLGWTNPLLLIPIAILGFIVARVVALSRRGSAKLATAHAEDVITWASIGEGIGIPIVVTVLIILGHRDLILPGIAAVVGLHFLPMAYAIPFRAFYALGVALLIAAIVGILLRQPIGSEVAGVAAAAALWFASFAALRRESRALAGQPGIIPH